MSVQALARSDSDPWKACHWGVTSHPRYHDCEHCSHALYGCKYGESYLIFKQLEAFKEKAQELIDSLPPYPSLDPKRLP